MDIAVSFPGGLKVNAQYDDFVIETDQKPTVGGAGSAPEPYAYFLTSIATCAGIYALRFCQSRDIPADSVGLRLHNDWHQEKGVAENIYLELTLTPAFPERYRDALVRAIDQCSVKKTIANNPNIEVRITS